MVVDWFGDVVVAMSLFELLAQGERRKPLELLRELFWAMEGEGLVALPAQLVAGAGLAVGVLLVLHQVEGVALHGVRGHIAVLVVRTDDVQVVVEADLNRVLIPEELGVGAVPEDGVPVGLRHPGVDPEQSQDQGFHPVGVRWSRRSEIRCPLVVTSPGSAVSPRLQGRLVSRGSRAQGKGSPSSAGVLVSRRALPTEFASSGSGAGPGRGDAREPAAVCSVQ